MDRPDPQLISVVKQTVRETHAQERQKPAPRFLSTEAAAAYLGVVAKKTLDNWRSEKPPKGPRFHKMGRKIAYAIADLDAWAAGFKDEG